MAMSGGSNSYLSEKELGPEMSFNWTNLHGCSHEKIFHVLPWNTIKDGNLDLCPIGLACLTHEHRYKHALWDKFSNKITGLHKNSGYWFLDLCTLFFLIHLVFIHSIVCSVTGSWPLPKWGLHRVQSSASFFNFHYLLSSFRSLSSCLHHLPLLPITSSFPSVTCFR
jgi:hypothetical protein